MNEGKQGVSVKSLINGRDARGKFAGAAKPLSLDRTPPRSCEVCGFEPKGEASPALRPVMRMWVCSSECQERAVDLQAESLVAERIEAVKAAIGVPPLYAGSYRDHLAIRAVPQFLYDWCDYPGLFFVGPPGAGKTTVASLWLEFALPHFVRGGKILASWAGAPELANQARRRVEHNSVEAFMEAYRTPDLLVLDDLGAEYRSGWALALFYELLDHRMTHCRFTVVTTTVTLAEWAGIDPRIASRLSLFKIISFDDPDRRQQEDVRRFVGALVSSSRMSGRVDPELFRTGVRYGAANVES